MKTLAQWQSRATLLALGLALTACSQAPVTTAVKEKDPYAGGVSHPWTDQVTLDPANPYAGGRAFPWQGPGTSTALHTAALGSGDHWLSDVDWTPGTASNAWGPIERNMSNGEQLAGDGRTLTIGGQTYTKGLGVHANSSVSYALGGACSTFSASVGIDGEVGARGSVIFQVFADGVKVADSGVVRGGEAPRTLSASVSGKNELRLVVTDAGDGIDYDHADWGNARVTCPTTTPGDANTFTYSSVTDQPHVVAEAQGQVVNGKLYTFGGFDSLKSGFTPTDRAYVYDPSANTWAPIARMPNRGATHAALTTDGTNIFYAGGYVANADWTGQIYASREVWRYNVVANTYTRLPDLPVERAAGGFEYLNGKLHYFGGTNLSRQDVGDHFVLDLTAGSTSWAAAASLPNPRNHLGAAVLAGKIYAVGGARGQDEDAVRQASVHAYDPATGTWTAVANLPRARSHNADTTFVLGNRVVVVGGASAHNVTMREVTAYSPSSNTWTELTPLPIGREASIADAIGKGFVITGGNQPGWVKSGWRATPSP